MYSEALISIIVPVYNTEKFIHKCLDSIAAQTYTNWEAILIDDGSPDSCGIICDEYAKLDNYRSLRTGFPEAIYAEGKTDEDLIKIILNYSNKNFLVTRLIKSVVNGVYTFFVIGVCNADYYIQFA